MKKKLLIVTGMVVVALVYMSCSKVLPSTPEDDEVLDGPVEGLSSEEKISILPIIPKKTTSNPFTSWKTGR